MSTTERDDDVSAHLARNLVSLRGARGMSQVDLGKKADLPRSTIANLERGDGNPSLAVLVKVARALGAPIDELLAAPREKVRKYAPAEMPELRRAGRGVSMKPIVVGPSPHEVMAIVTFERGGVMPGLPHLPGTREFFTLLEGHVAIIVAGEKHELLPGELLAFPGNVPHGYQNLAKGTSRGVSVVLLSSSGV
ncbi:MAG: helix-turn-helix domain-containing protein [Sandaracinus sp.]